LGEKKTNAVPVKDTPLGGEKKNNVSNTKSRDDGPSQGAEKKGDVGRRGGEMPIFPGERKERLKKGTR